MYRFLCWSSFSVCQAGIRAGYVAVAWSLTPMISVRFENILGWCLCTRLFSFSNVKRCVKGVLDIEVTSLLLQLVLFTVNIRVMWEVGYRQRAPSVFPQVLLSSGKWAHEYMWFWIGTSNYVSRGTNYPLLAGHATLTLSGHLDHSLWF